MFWAGCARGIVSVSSFPRRAQRQPIPIFTRLFRLGRPARCAHRFFPARSV